MATISRLMRHLQDNHYKSILEVSVVKWDFFLIKYHSLAETRVTNNGALALLQGTYEHQQDIQIRFAFLYILPSILT